MDDEDREERPICRCGKAIYRGLREADRDRRSMQRHGKDRRHEGRLIVYRCDFGRLHLGHRED